MYVLGTFGGYWIHRLGHCRWKYPFFLFLLGRIHKSWFSAHTMSHHIKLYPNSRFSSDVVLETDEPNEPFYSPLIVFGVCLTYYLYDFTTSFIVTLSLIAIHMLISNIHDAYHLNHSRLDYFNWFNNLKKVHRIHHNLQNKTICNFGMLDMTWDIIFDTLKTPEDN